MKTLLIVLILFLFFSCQNDQEKLREKIRPIIQNIVLQDSVVSKIDSIKIYRIDTLTELDYTKRRIINLLDKSDYFLEMERSYSDQSKEKGQEANLSLTSEKLDAEIQAPTLVDIARRDVITDAQEAKRLLSIARQYLDSSTYCANLAVTLQKKIEHHQVNNKEFLGYKILFKVLGSDKRNMEVKKDSLNTFLSPSFRIIPITKI